MSVGVGAGVPVGVGVRVSVGVGVRVFLGRGGGGCGVCVGEGSCVCVGGGTYIGVGVRVGVGNASTGVSYKKKSGVGQCLGYLHVGSRAGVAVEEGVTVGIWAGIIVAEAMGVAVAVGMPPALVLLNANEMIVTTDTRPTTTSVALNRRSTRRSTAPIKGSNTVELDGSTTRCVVPSKGAAFSISTLDGGEPSNASCISATL